MALSYTAMAQQASMESFILRVQEALLQDVNNGTTRMEALPPAVSDVTVAAQRDRLARAIVADPHAWALKFARLVAMQLIAKSTLLDETVTTDSDIFSAESAVYDRFLSG